MEITQGVYMLDCTKKSHAYLIQGEENILIDSGSQGLAQKILDEINSIGIDPSTINHILLTHHDVDNVGNARILQENTGAMLWASKEDMPYIIRRKSRRGIKRIIQTFVRYKKPIINKVYNKYDIIGGIQVIKTPGHTPGHVIFLYRNILFSGDLFKITKGKIKLVSDGENWNKYNLEKSLGLLKNIEFHWICPSHGSPIERNEVWENFINKY
ncbi:MBL fold metallo-hydrolase [Clostridium sp.]|uniref:MBL fold metallo-hydrolase n=1 Tax=Clostridium sp. TaxID=1506 RepID=UPI00261575AF|nr:MBL fold metallo-hydrolase [Clostridium sp.]